MKNNGRQLWLPGIADTATMVAEAIAYLQIHEPPEGYFVGFSGGKDSICALELCRMAGVKHKAYYSCTRIDPPEVVRFIRQHYPDVEFLFPKMTFWEGIRKKAPPLRIKRWCCDVLKKDPSKDVPLKNRVMGIRAEESATRAARGRESVFRGNKSFKPIFCWTEYHVWDFIEGNWLPYPSLYDEGLHRLGCVICPFTMGKSPGKVRQREISMQRWPGMWKAFERTCSDWFYSTRLREGANMKEQKHETFEAYYQAYLRGFE